MLDDGRNLRLGRNLDFLLFFLRKPGPQSGCVREYLRPDRAKKAVGIEYGFGGFPLFRHAVDPALNISLG